MGIHLFKVSMNTIQLHQQRQQSTFSLHATRITTQSAPAAADGIDLIDEDDAW